MNFLGILIGILLLLGLLGFAVEFFKFLFVKEKNPDQTLITFSILGKKEEEEEEA